MLVQGDLLDSATENAKAAEGQAQPGAAQVQASAAAVKGAAAEPQKPSGSSDGKISLNKLVADSKNPEAERIKKEIDDAREQRAKLIGKANEYRRRLAYKEKESVVIERLLKAEEAKGGERNKNGRIGYLKRMKNKLEFKISTEASSLSEERMLVRKIDEISKQLDEALALVRLERKRDLVKSDIEQYRKGVVDVEKEITDSDVKLDATYSELRKVLGIGKWQNKPKPLHAKKAPSQKVQEINLEDIAVIKRKEAKHSTEGA
jgi:uncharacterized coiled-coil DUF342 family protein